MCCIDRNTVRRLNGEGGLKPDFSNLAMTVDEARDLVLKHDPANASGAHEILLEVSGNQSKYRDFLAHLNRSGQFGLRRWVGGYAEFWGPVEDWIDPMTKVMAGV